MVRVYTIIILAVLLFASMGAGYYTYQKWRAAEREAKSLTQINGVAFKSVEQYKNRYNKIVAKNESLTLNNKSIKELVKEGQLPVLKQFEGLKRNYRNLEQLIQSNILVSGQVKIPIDTAGNFFFDDSFNFVQGNIKNDTLHISDSIRVPLSVVVYWQRSWLLGRKKYSAEAVSDNPKAIIKGLESIQVIRK